MDDNIAEKCSKSLVIPEGLTTDHMALKFFPETTPFLKVDCFEGIIIGIKLMEWWMIIQAAVTHSHSTKSMQMLLKNCLQFVVKPTTKTTDAMALKFLQTLSSYCKANTWKDFWIESDWQNSDQSFE